jgi:hypothetical protein
MQQTLDRAPWPGGVALLTRAALHTGEAELRDHDYFRQALNQAARLRALGRGGQILLSRATAELVADQLPEGAGLVDVGSHLLKGLSRPENVFAIVHPDLAAPPPTLTERAEHPDRVVFVGRGAERARLRAALDSALGGQGQLVLIAGEAGIGKTRIAEELCAEARSREARVAWGRCREGAGAPAYWPWRQALRAYAAGRPSAEVAGEFLRGEAERSGGNVGFSPTDTEAFQEGTVGWAATRLTISLRDGRQVSPRWSTVLHQEDGQWRFVQTHASIAVRNDEIGWVLPS